MPFKIKSGDRTEVVECGSFMLLPFPDDISSLFSPCIMIITSAVITGNRSRSDPRKTIGFCNPLILRETQRRRMPIYQASRVIFNKEAGYPV